MTGERNRVAWQGGVVFAVLALVGCDEPDARSLHLSPPSTNEPTQAGCGLSDDCPSDRRHCSSGLCVECLADEHCSAKKPACQSGTCVACTGDEHCLAGEACNTALRVCASTCSTDPDCAGQKPEHCNGRYCVECIADEQCDDRHPHCAPEGGTCLECGSDADCATPMRPVCAADNRCVECAEDDDCTRPDSPFCVSSRGTCGKCRSDADCGDAGVCDVERAECAMAMP